MSKSVEKEGNLETSMDTNAETSGESSHDPTISDQSAMAMTQTQTLIQIKASRITLMQRQNQRIPRAVQQQKQLRMMLRVAVKRYRKLFYPSYEPTKTVIKSLEGDRCIERHDVWDICQATVGSNNQKSVNRYLGRIVEPNKWRYTRNRLLVLNRKITVEFDHLSGGTVSKVGICSLWNELAVFTVCVTCYMHKGF